MMIPIPILRDHNPQSVIGKATPQDGRLIVEFTREAEVTMEMALTAFGSLRLIESFHADEGIVLVLKAEVYEFSVLGGGR